MRSATFMARTRLAPTVAVAAVLLLATAASVHGAGETLGWEVVNAGAPWSKRAGHSSVVLANSGVLVFGGYKEGIVFNDVWSSIDDGVTWTPVVADGAAPWPKRSGQAAATLGDGSIVLAGGSTGNDRVNDVWRSTDNGATWNRQTGAAGWSKRAGHTMVVLGDDTLLLAGGYNSGDIHNDVWKSTDKGATWEQVTQSGPWWSPRSGHTCVTLQDGSIMIAGGSPINERLNDVWLSTDQGATWTEKTPNAAWQKRMDHTSVVLPSGAVLICGGYDAGTWYRNCYESSDAGATWQRQGPLVTVVAKHTMVVLLDGTVLTMGGATNADGGTRLNTVWKGVTCSDEACSAVPGAAVTPATVAAAVVAVAAALAGVAR